MKDITAETLRGLLDYDPETGEFRWRVSRGNRIKVGAAAGTVSSNSYAVIKINGMPFKAHRLAWLHFHGGARGERHGGGSDCHLPADAGNHDAGRRLLLRPDARASG